MSPRREALRAWLPRILIAVVVTALYMLSRAPSVSAGERASLTARFSFQRLPLPEATGFPKKKIRAVSPELKHVAAWMSSMGASVALADLDGDGLPNDLCHIDPRTDTVMVAPVPGTPQRYAPIILDPAPLRFSRATMAPLVCVPADLNEDGQMDLLVTYWGRTPIAFLRAGDHYVPRDVVDNVEIWNAGATATADLDGDGHVDLIIGNYFQDGAPILDESSHQKIELQQSMSRAFNGGRTHILRWVAGTGGPEPTVRYEEVRDAFDEEVARGWTLAIGARDLDGDLLPELYLAHDFGPDRLLHNRSTPGHIKFAVLEGKRRFSSARSKVVGHDSFKGMGVDFGDLDGDGITDIFVSDLTSFALQENHMAFIGTGDTQAMKEGIAPYVDRSEPLGLAHSGWAWDNKLADFDNDGVPEVVQACGFVRGEVSRWPELEELAMENDGMIDKPSTWPRFDLGDDLSGHESMPFFVRLDGRYVNISADLGLADPQVSRGIAIADVDGDGDLDFAIANQWDTSWFVRNDCPNCGAFLGLHLRLPLAPAPTAVHSGHPSRSPATRPAIGAQATVTLPDGRRLSAEVDGGNGHSGKRSPDIHFGLGHLPSSTSLSVNLRWRDPRGQIHEETRQLMPGWQTIDLGWQ